jgi:hypothetical protein
VNKGLIKKEKDVIIFIKETVGKTLYLRRKKE